MALLYGPLFGPVLFAVMTAFIVGKQNEDAEKSLSIPVIGAEHAPNLIGFLRQQGVTIKAAPADPEGAIRAQDEDVIVRLTPAFGEAWLAGEPAKVDLLLDEMSRDEPAQGAVLDRMLDLLTIAALRSWFSRDDAPAWYRAYRDPQVGTALRLIENNPAHPWTVGSLAAEVGLSRAALARRFTQLVGEPPMALLTEIRLALAVDLLRGSDATIEAVAGRVGYGTAFALSTAIKRRYGMSPKAIRAASP